MSTPSDDTARTTPHLDLAVDPVQLTRDLVDIASPSREEDAIAAAVHAALERTVAGFTGPAAGATTVERIGNCVVARTARGLSSRVVLAGHLDTVPLADNIPAVIKPVPTGTGGDGDGHGATDGGTDATTDGGTDATTDGDTEERMYGCGTSDMKAGDAVFLHLFAELADAAELTHDLTLIMYDCEEIEASANGLGKLQAARPELLDGDLAILGEPTDGLVEAGCQGTLRVRVTARGVRAHSARSWLGDNALHRLAPVYARLAEYAPRSVVIDGCEYREGLQAVRAAAGVSGNVVPDEASVEVNFRFAPDRDADAALAHAVEALGLSEAQRLADDDRHPHPTEPGLYWQLTDMSPGALPGLANPAAAEFVAFAGGADGGAVRAKYGWTDVSRFAAAGVAAVNLGPGDPGMAHKRDEFCRVAEIGRVTDFLRGYLTGGAGSH